MTPPKSRRKVWLWISGIAALGFFYAMVQVTAPLDPDATAPQFVFDAAAFNAIVARWQAADLARFRVHFAFDFPFLVSYGGFGYLLVHDSGWFEGFMARTRTRIARLLPIAAVLDAIENCLQLYLLDAHAPAAVLYPLAGGIACAKWLLAAIFVAIALFALLRHLVRGH